MDCKYHNSIEHLGEADVSRVSGDSLDFSYGMLYAIESSLPKGLIVRYCCVYDEDDLIAFVPVYIGTNVNINALAPDFIERSYNVLLNIFGESIGLKVAIAGCLISDKGFIPMDLSHKQSDMMSFIAQGVDQLCQQESVSLCVFKDMHESVYDNYRQALLKQSYFPAYSLPTIVIDNDFASFSEYQASLTKNGRKHCKKTFRKAKESNLTLEVIDDFKDLNIEICALFRNTFVKAKYQFEEFSPHFFYSLAESENPQTELIVCKNDGKIVGALMNLYRHNQVQLNKRIGMDYSQEDTGLIYMLLNYYGIKSAIEHGVKKIYLGQSTYIPKTRLGGYLEDQFLFMKTY